MDSHLIIRRKFDHNRNKGEESDFPILCASCLGDNPYVRMTKESMGLECKVCVRPFTVFRWKPGPKERFKKTEICQTCSKVKNVCQTCLLDLTYALPEQIRDQAMPESVIDEKAVSEVNREFFQERYEQKIAEGQLNWDKTGPQRMLAKLARTQPYYVRDGADRQGRGGGSRSTDSKTAAVPLEEPDDKSVTTLFVGGVTPAIREDDIRYQFYPFGTITSIRIIPNKNCAFVTYAAREEASRAADALHSDLTIKNIPLSLNWSRSQAQPRSSAPPAFPMAGMPGMPFPGMPPMMPGMPPMMPGMPPMMPGMPPMMPGMPPMPPMPGAGAFAYPSMDPSRVGARGDREESKKDAAGDAH